jgi:hypothetical protein
MLLLLTFDMLTVLGSGYLCLRLVAHNDGIAGSIPAGTSDKFEGKIINVVIG